MRWIPISHDGSLWTGCYTDLAGFVRVFGQIEAIKGNPFVGCRARVVGENIKFGFPNIKEAVRWLENRFKDQVLFGVAYNA